ncbi:MAG: nicotinate phosphoribosyltransferase, partial [Spirochaetales bacterium]|nr:nicotinate phosphoribosyltransferase [Spirochaetales bacterium]
NDSPIGDLMTFHDEQLENGPSYKFTHPMYRFKSFKASGYKEIKPLLKKRLENGKICTDLPKIKVIRENVISDINKLDRTYKRLINPHIYKVSLSDSLAEVKFRMLDEHAEANGK